MSCDVFVNSVTQITECEEKERAEGNVCTRIVRFQVHMATCMKMSSGLLRRVVWKFTDVSEVLFQSG
jgi:hypothetical protein